MVKIKNYLAFTSILFSYSSFALKTIQIAKDNNQHRIVLNVINNQIPAKDIRKKIPPVQYDKLNITEQKLVQHFWKDDGWRYLVNLFNYKEHRSFSKDSDYLVFQGPTPNPKEYIYYTFSWKKKSYKELKGFEKQLADYYNADNSSEIEFLYAWKHYDADPWAIKVNGTMHATIWVQAQAVNQPTGQKPNSFLDVPYEDERKNIQVLVNEYDHIVGKRINGRFVINK